MPSLFRFLFICAILAGIAYAGMFALATMVEPEPREMRVKIPSERINP
ncbi:MAG: histidine kinase [Pseudomonadota bacterium]